MRESGVFRGLRLYGIRCPFQLLLSRRGIPSGWRLKLTRNDLLHELPELFPRVRRMEGQNIVKDCSQNINV
jgi:hypothetical protein